MSSPLEILKKYWNYPSFRTPQDDIIEAVLEGKDVVALLPTGGGKSLCFQVPGLIRPGICIVISPLIALMQDQVTDLNQRGIKALMLESGWNIDETVTVFDNLRFGKYKFLYLSPERLQSEFIREKLKQLPVNLIAVDEAHCISEWGHDFRTSYLKIAVLKELFPDINTIALTATATPLVLEDIKKYLNINNSAVFQKSFYRENIHYNIRNTIDIHKDLYEALRNAEQSIVYVKTRKATVSISRFLNRKGLKTVFYHGGMDAGEKKQNYQLWADGSHPVMIATNAFGMGIDKSDVRLIVHTGIPFSMENYVQETGRAGRDGKPAKALLFYNNNSLLDLDQSAEKDLVTVAQCRDVYIALNKYYEIGLGELPEKIFDFDIEEFCRIYRFPVVQAYNALIVLDRESIIEFRQSVYSRTKLRVRVSGDVLFDYFERNNKQQALLNLILRSYGGVMDQYAYIDLYIIAKRLGISKKMVLEGLRQMDKDGIISFKEKKIRSQIMFLVPREDNYTINRIAPHINKRNKIKKQKISAIRNWILDDASCRYAGILAYFGEKPAYFSCGNCDVCQKNEKVKQDPERIKNEIINLLTETPLTSRELTARIPFNEGAVLKILRLLLDNGTLRLNSQLKFSIYSKN